MSHAKAQRRKDDMTFAPLRLCVRFFCSVSFVLCFALLLRGGMLLLTPDGLQERIPTATGGWRRILSSTARSATADVPTAYRPPLYPLLLTGCVAFGDYGRVAVGVLARSARRGDRRAGARCWGDGGDWDAAAPPWPRCWSPATRSCWPVRRK